jgi:hypothetical protein
LYAFAVRDNVAFVALLADSLLRIELLASTLNFAANSIFIEEEPIGALKTRVLTPDFTAEIVVQLCEQSGIVEFGSRECIILCISLS